MDKVAEKKPAGLEAPSVRSYVAGSDAYISIIRSNKVIWYSIRYIEGIDEASAALPIDGDKSMKDF